MPSLDHDDFIARCEGLVSTLRDEAAESEQLRQLTSTTLRAVVDADILRAVVPKSLGGHGLGLPSLCQGTRILAHGCPATAWTVSFFMLHAWLLTKFPAESHPALFGGGRVPSCAAPLAPTGTAEAVEGGYVVGGRWEYATGVEHAHWVMVHALEAGPELASRFLLLDVDDVVIEDVWHTSGMRATGSNTIVVDGVFVPEAHSIPGRALLESAHHLPGDALANLPLVSVLALTASAPAVGAGEEAALLYHQRLQDRVLAYSMGDEAAEQPAAQMRLATVMNDMRGARSAWESAIRRVGGAARRGIPTDQLRVDTKLAAAAAVRDSRHVITLVGEGAGAAVYRSDHPFQRLQRDVETIKGHVIFDWDRASELAGRVLLGGELGPTDMA